MGQRHDPGSQCPGKRPEHKVLPQPFPSPGECEAPPAAPATAPSRVKTSKNKPRSQLSSKTGAKFTDVTMWMRLVYVQVPSLRRLILKFQPETLLSGKTPNARLASLKMITFKTQGQDSGKILGNSETMHILSIGDKSRFHSSANRALRQMG